MTKSNKERYLKNKDDYKKLKTMIQQTVSSNIETKFHNTTFVYQSVPDGLRNGVDSNLSGIATGDSQITRTGNQIYVTGINARLWVQNADSTNTVRFIMYIPKDASEDLGTNTYTINTVPDLDHYTILMDKTYHVDTYNPIKNVYGINRKFNKGARKGIRVTFNGTGATNLAKNPIRFYVVSDSGAVSDPTISGTIRLYFKDA